MSLLVTQAGPVAHSPGWPPARPAPGPHARGRGSSSGSGVWTTSAPDSPPCSPCDRPASSSTADAARYAGRGETVDRSSGTCVVFASSSAGTLPPPMMGTSTPDRDVGRRRAEEDEEAFTGSSSKKTPPKKTAVSDRWNHYTFKPVLALAKGLHRRYGHSARVARPFDARSAPLTSQGGRIVGRVRDSADRPASRRTSRAVLSLVDALWSRARSPGSGRQPALRIRGQTRRGPAADGVDALRFPVPGARSHGCCACWDADLRDGPGHACAARRPPERDAGAAWGMRVSGWCSSATRLIPTARGTP